MAAWTMQRAGVVGITIGIAAILVASLPGAESEALLRFYALLLVGTALCGFSILWITATDMRRRGTSGLIRPIRGFDAALGLILLVPAVYALVRVRPALGF